MKFLFLLLTLISFSQNKMSYNMVADYAFEWQSDSLDIKSRVKTENFKLYLSTNESVFVSENRIGLDTIIYNNASVADLNKLMSLPQPSSNKRIIRSKNKTVVYDAFMSKTFSYDDEIILDWKLSEMDTIINSIPVSTATVNFRGRKYTAWYSKEIPISEGPYKFYGLPGLIIKISDDKKEVLFSLVSFKKFEKNKELILDYNMDSQKTTFDEYYKTYKAFMDNPIPYLESEGMVFNPETKKIIREKYKERNKKSNNIIELKNK